MILISLGVFFLMLLAGFPLFITMLGTALTGFLYLGDMGQLRIIVQQFYGGVSPFALLAIPYFILVGELMNSSGMSIRLLRFAESLVGHTKGGLGYITVVTSIIFSGINGSASADASAVGSIMLPAMKKGGYPDSYAAGLVAGSSLIGPIIPPSIFMILLGAMTATDVGGLFMAGVIPGLLLGLAFIVMHRISAVKLNLPVANTAFSFKKFLSATVGATPALIAPGIIIGGILFGFMTPTESGAVASLYVLVVGLFWTRELNMGGIWIALSNTVRLTSVIFLIIGGATVIGWLLTYEQVTQTMAPLIMQYTSSPTQVLLLISLITFLIGMFMEEIAVLVLLTPVFYPLAITAGIDPLHFGIVMTLNITIALITPPMGGCIYIVSSIGGVSLEKMFKTIWPFVLVALVCQLFIITIPGISLWFPHLLGY
ncbi:TRAP dicarboxylate transporter, DctM subunit [Arcobacter nitrofigilis DSM 7299]|uniref:TRAP dicarboxylate transporter, DctM subunit n=1 Tax=Arcobacter nitrofigilis (strain ATCC 33309 / DSM 7299 / CCUG 15893 / LMG 7604 / NCTC 12251 / CI) TaxID=572480 RepID=D5V335_ARCNC|nr:TRAP transporter large permease [Arcobacter nitrofigilis]ADG92617.1 TRAP dicarboxylate transporter, DctM subunit [Arcobacter nitrofigilis DSM 7299]